MICDDPDMFTRLADVLALLYRHGPEHFDMANWLTLPGPDDGEPTIDPIQAQLDAARGSAFAVVPTLDSHELFSRCGTACCLAGYAMLAGATPRTATTYNWEVQVAQWLGMDHGLINHDSGDVTRWFFVGRWPNWAFEMRNRKMRRGMDEHVAEFEVVTEVLGDLIAGRRAHWHDSDVG